MPDASGRIRGISVPADAWERVFGPKPRDWTGVHTCHVECPCHTGGQPVADFEGAV